VAIRVASVIRVSGASMRPARIHPPKRPKARRNARTRAAAGGAVLLGLLGYHSLAASASWAASPRETRQGEGHGSLDAADGVVPEGTTVLDDDVPGVANLDPELLRALRRAARGAARDGVELRVNSGWRSRRYQDRLFREAVARYGSREKAARWVAAPGTAAHESGDAVDIGPSSAAIWLSEQAATYGLWQPYANERWHYQLRPRILGNQH
jgi:D-alanyl-D-alanine carboxypeptidase